MSDLWKIYPCQMGPDRAWIMFDFGISKAINTVAPPLLLRIRIAFKHPRPDGMPDGSESQQLHAIDEDVQTLAQTHGALYVGRITVAGHRHFYVYTPEDDAAWEPRLAGIGKRHQYQVASYIEADEERNGYWKELYPDENSWQVMKDMELLDVLRKQGDDGITPRQIEHWAYFAARTDASRFAAWAREQGYVVKPVTESKDGKFAVHFFHEGVLELTVITSQSIRLNRTAKEFHGSYDGWETPVCSSGPPPKNGSKSEPNMTPSGKLSQESWMQKLLRRWKKD